MIHKSTSLNECSASPDDRFISRYEGGACEVLPPSRRDTSPIRKSAPLGPVKFSAAACECSTSRDDPFIARYEGPACEVLSPTYCERCEDRIGTDPPRARTEVIFCRLRILGYFGLDPPKRGSGLVGNKLIRVQKSRTLEEDLFGRDSLQNLQYMALPPREVPRVCGPAFLPVPDAGCLKVPVLGCENATRVFRTGALRCLLVCKSVVLQVAIYNTSSRLNVTIEDAPFGEPWPVPLIQVRDTFFFLPPSRSTTIGLTKKMRVQTIQLTKGGCSECKCQDHSFRFSRVPMKACGPASGVKSSS